MPVMMLMGNTFFHFPKSFRESIINGGENKSPSPEFSLRKLLRFCLSRLAISLKTVPPVVKIHAATKKRILLFGRMRANIACGYFQANGINMVHFAPKWPVFATLYRSYDTKSVDRLHRREQQHVTDRRAVGQHSILTIPPKPRPPVGAGRTQGR